MRDIEKTNEYMMQHFWGSMEHLEFVLAESDAAYNYARTLPYSIVQTFTTCMLERLNVAATGLNSLFGHYLGERKYEFSIGIILRSSYLDYLIVLNAMEIIFRHAENRTDHTKELDDFCLAMLSDTAIHTLRYFDANAHDIPKDRLKGMYIQLVRLHIECFEPYAFDGRRPTLKTTTTYSQQELVKRLKKSKYSHLSRKEDAYVFYSKYDHFGKMYSGISKRPLTDEFIHMGVNLRELPRSFAVMLALLLILFPRDERLLAFRDKLEPRIKAIEHREEKERNDAVSGNK